MDGRMDERLCTSVNGVVHGRWTWPKSVKKSEASKDGRPETFLP